MKKKTLLEEILELSPDVAETVDTEAEDWEDLIDTHEAGTKDALSESVDDDSDSYYHILRKRAEGNIKRSETIKNKDGNYYVTFEFDKISLSMTALKDIFNYNSGSIDYATMQIYNKESKTIIAFGPY